MPISDDELYKNANSYRLHQDVLRWSLLAGYAAFLVGIISLNRGFNLLSGIALVAIGYCYMCILAVENFFYNLYAEYVKDCESRAESSSKLRTVREFSSVEAHRISPFHHSFFFAVTIVLFGNFMVVGFLSSHGVRIAFYVLNIIIFLAIFLAWKTFVFPYIVLPIQRIFDVSAEDKNYLWKLRDRIRRRRAPVPNPPLPADPPPKTAAGS